MLTLLYQMLSNFFFLSFFSFLFFSFFFWTDFCCSKASWHGWHWTYIPPCLSKTYWPSFSKILAGPVHCLSQARLSYIESPVTNVLLLVRTLHLSAIWIFNYNKDLPRFVNIVGILSYYLTCFQGWRCWELISCSIE